MVDVSYSVSVASGPGPATVELADIEWRVREVELDERLGEPWTLRLRLLAPGAVPVDALVGASLTWLMEASYARERGDVVERRLRGVVIEASSSGIHEGLTHLSVLVMPQLALGQLTVRSRIFEGLSVPEIVQQALAHLQGVRVDMHAVTRRPRDYCVQHRESDLAFVQRIVAEEGLTHVLEYPEDEDGEVLRLLDGEAGGSAFAAAGVFPGDDAPSAPETVPLIGERAEQAGVPCVLGVERWRRAAIATHRVRAWDWLASSAAPIDAEAAPTDPEPGALPLAPHETHGTRRLFEASGGHDDDTEELALRLRERARAASGRVRGSANTAGFRVGRSFALEGHPDETMNIPWLLARVVHRGDCPEVDVQAQAQGLHGPAYECRFEGQPLDVPYRPATLPKPRIHGHQTGQVIGPPGEEIHTDAHGRIKVWMHWDREGPDAALDRSCWLRVAQPLAGSGFGTVFLPRVGMEVLVSFVDGDPDRPVCTGCLYDGSNPPPYPLPDDKTKTVLRTRSVPGGNGHNELRFEDAAGAEEIHLHAQRNLDEKVRAAHSMRVGSTQTVSVGANQSTKVGGSREIEVGGNLTTKVTGAPKVGPPEGYTLTVMGNIKADATKSVKVVAPVSIDLVCGKSLISMTHNAIKLVSGDGAALLLGSGMAVSAAGGATQLMMDASGAATLASKGGGQLGIDLTKVQASVAGSKLCLDGTVTVAAQGGAKVELTRDAVLSGESVIADGQGQAKITVRGGVDVEGAHAAIDAGSVNIDAKGETSVRGASVKIQGQGIVTALGPVVKIN